MNDEDDYSLHNSPINCVFNCCVVSYGYDDSRGNYVVIEATDDCNNVYCSSQKLRVIYMHMDAPYNGELLDFYSKNETIGIVGKSGVKAYHLHMGLIIDNTIGENNSSVIDPLLLYPSETFLCS